VDAACAEVSEELYSCCWLEGCVEGCVSLVGGFVDEIGHTRVHVQLPGFFFEGHAADQVPQSLFDGKIGLLVGRLGLTWHRGSCQK
jgi:hypothetical protein